MIGCARAVRSAERPANHLAGETSPYLLQHAHNPVDWYPWGPAAFERAKKENRPIFLSIGYSSCHWCHVMERESFEDESIARLLNEHFVAIKVDREERPDLDEIYMSAVQMMTGSGGWPMTTVLTPDGRPFFGGTYLPREELADLLSKVHAAWSDPKQRASLEQLASRVADRIGQASLTAARGKLSPALVRDAAQAYLSDYDPQDGGFGRAPKFPPSMRLSLMLAEQRRHPSPKLLHAVTLTLDRMGRGGMYDQVGGGFHRYSTDARWLVPHFEKMLYDNAQLAGVYLDTYQATGNPFYRRIATETLDFTLREMRDSRAAGGGGFWSTLDADSPGGEGRFYLWTPAEVTAVLGKTDGALFCRIYGITPAGNFEGRSIPNLLDRSVEEWAKAVHTNPTALWGRLDGMRARLRAARARRPRPSLDDKVLTSWNGLMLQALAAGYRMTGAPRYREAADRAADFLLSTMERDGKLRHSYRQGRTQPQAFLEDYSFLTVGLLDLYEATREPRRLQAAKTLAQAMVAQFWDEHRGAFFNTPREHELLLARLQSAEDDAVPSGASMAALALVQLSRLTGDASFGATARRLLESHAGTMKQYPQAMPQMLLAADALFSAPAAGPAAHAERPVRLAVARAPGAVRPGQAFEVALRLEIAPGWHVNAHRPTDPALIPTRVELAPGSAFRLLAIDYPAAHTVRLRFSDRPLAVYEGQSTLHLRLKAPERPRTGAAGLSLRLHYQPCDDYRCLLPAEAALRIPIQVVTSEAR
jgi:uncharacterized protein YyaL (SSP411 family)